MNIIGELLLDIAGGIARALVAALLGFLLHKGLIDAGKVGHYTAGLTTLMTAVIAGIAFTIASSVWAKVRAWYRVKVALALPAGSNVQKLATAVDQVDANRTSIASIATNPTRAVSPPAHLMKPAK
jgi:ABC-type multidrug transport system fused ATPase/permease subunit